MRKIKLTDDQFDLLVRELTMSIESSQDLAEIQGLVKLLEVIEEEWTND